MRTMCQVKFVTITDFDLRGGIHTFVRAVNCLSAVVQLCHC